MLVLAFWLAKKLRLLGNSWSFTLYGKWTIFVFTILLATVSRCEEKCLQNMTFTNYIQNNYRIKTKKKLYQEAESSMQNI